MWSFQVSKRVINKTINSASTLYKWNYLSVYVIKNIKRSTHTTVDPSGVEIFSKSTKEWWNPEGEMSLLHRMNLIRIPFVRDGLVPCSDAERDILPLKNKKILDVGCGGGILSEGLARLGAVVTGIDVSPELIAVAEEHKHIDPKIANNKPTYLCKAIEEHTKTIVNYYDGVVASEVIEHVNNQDLFVKSCVQTLKPGGRIFFTSPNKTRLSQCLVIFVTENILGLAPKGAHQYEKFLHSNELAFMLERNNCHVELSYGLVYNPLTRRWDFSQYQHLLYAIQAVKLS